MQDFQISTTFFFLVLQKAKKSAFLSENKLGQWLALEAMNEMLKIVKNALKKIKLC